MRLIVDSFGRGFRLAIAGFDSPLQAGNGGESEGVCREEWWDCEGGWLGPRCAEEGFIDLTWSIISTPLVLFVLVQMIIWCMAFQKRP